MLSLACAAGWGVGETGDTGVELRGEPEDVSIVVVVDSVCAFAGAVTDRAGGSAAAAAAANVTVDVAANADADAADVVGVGVVAGGIVAPAGVAAVAVAAAAVEDAGGGW